VTLTLTSDDLESHMVVNVSSTLTNSTIWSVAALCLIVDVPRTYGHTYVRTYGRTDTFTGFIRFLGGDDLKTNKQKDPAANIHLAALGLRDAVENELVGRQQSEAAVN